MSLVRTSGKNSASVEFRQEVLKSNNPVQPSVVDLGGVKLGQLGEKKGCVSQR